MTCCVVGTSARYTQRWSLSQPLHRKLTRQASDKGGLVSRARCGASHQGVYARLRRAMASDAPQTRGTRAVFAVRLSSYFLGAAIDFSRIASSVVIGVIAF